MLELLGWIGKHDVLFHGIGLWYQEIRVYTVMENWIVQFVDCAVPGSRSSLIELPKRFEGVISRLMGVY